MKWLLLFTIFFSNAVVAQVNLQSGLVAYYPFNGNANDESGNKNNPVFNNATLTTGKLGKKNTAYSFNGKNSYIHIKNNASLCVEEMTLVALIKPTGFFNGLCYNNAIIDKGSWDYNFGNYALRFTAGEFTQGDCNQPAFDHQNFVGFNSFNNGSTSKNNYVSLNNWYCVVYTSNKKESKLYLDGRLISTTLRTRSVGKNNADVYLGKKDNDQYPYWFKGIMDEIRIYNRALNKEEVIALCNLSGSSIPAPPCSGDDKPSADFNYTISDCYKINFEFLQNRQNIRSVNWFFGDGKTANTKSPSHTYDKFGKYKVKLIIMNKAGCSDTVTKEIQLRELNPDFTFAEQGEPGTIQFKAKNNNAAYSWNFGDGNSAKNESSTSHSYSESGQYAVQLVAQNNSGCKDTVEKEISISLPISITEVPPSTEPIIITNNAPEIKLEKRDKDVVRTIPVENDSISISLYDNGIIDGDSITLLFNNEIIVTHQLLGSKPLTLQLMIDRQRSSNELVMYAENLGSIPPNTALMIINDGNNRYQVNVTSSRSSNGIISFTLKK